MNDSGKSGLTLIELLLGLLIFSMIALTLYAVFSNGIKIYRRAQVIEQSERAARWVLDLVQHDLENAVPFRGDVFENGSIKMEQHSLELIRPGKQGLVKIRYFLTPEEQAHQHVVRIGDVTQRNKRITQLRQEREDRFYLIREVEQVGRLEQDLDPEKDETGSPAQREVLHRSVVEEGWVIQYAYQDFEEGGGEEPMADGSRPVVWKSTWETDEYPLYMKIFLKTTNPQRPGDEMEAMRKIYIPTGVWGGAHLIQEIPEP